MGSCQSLSMVSFLLCCLLSGTSQSQGGDDGMWKKEDNAWRNWYVGLYAEAVSTTVCLNHNLSEAAHRQQQDHGPKEFNFPVSVLNLESYKHRKSHIQRVLGESGFVNVSFPRVTPWREINFQQLELEGQFNDDFGYFQKRKQKFGEHGHMPYIAAALDHIKVITEAVEAGNPVFGVFEDDLIPGSTPREVQERISLALGELPETADMLYLEYCFERCRSVRYSKAHPHLIRAKKPFCAAAILFTLKGAKKVLQQIQPVWGPIDQMYCDLIMDGRLEAYLAHPVPFFQDSSLGSESKGRAVRANHEVQNVLCDELIALLAEDLDLTFVGSLGEANGSTQKLYIPGNLLHRSIWPNLDPGDVVAYYTPSHHSNEGPEVGVWRAETPLPQVLELTIPVYSKCYQASFCEVSMVRESAAGREDSSFRVIFLRHGAFV